MALIHRTEADWVTTLTCVVHYTYTRTHLNRIGNYFLQIKALTERTGWWCLLRTTSIISCAVFITQLLVCVYYFMPIIAAVIRTASRRRNEWWWLVGSVRGDGGGLHTQIVSSYKVSERGVPTWSLRALRVHNTVCAIYRERGLSELGRTQQQQHGAVYACVWHVHVC